MTLLGDSYEVMKNIPDNSVDAVVTDPPYGLKFMGKRWDHSVPSVELWREVFRVLKHGGYLLSFGGTRTYHRMVVNIEDAGFEIRDQLQWIYGSGFPKSHNLDGDWEGFGTALKPANEPVVLARKPLEKGLTVSENVLKYRTGALNVGGCRIGADTISFKPRLNHNINLNDDSWEKIGQDADMKTVNGRWPANVILDEDAAQMLDEQSGVLQKRGNKGESETALDNGTSLFGRGMKWKSGCEYNYDSDAGGASRFFYCAKASTSERNKGLEGLPLKKGGVKNSSGRGFSEGDPKAEIKYRNNHPTVKPIKLMEYLCKLVTPPSGVILDPFMGSGSTGVAAKNLGFGFIGIEKEKEYIEIAQKRIGEKDDWSFLA